MNILLNFNSQHVNRKALLPSVNLFTAMFAMLLFESNFIMGQSYLPPNSATNNLNSDIMGKKLENTKLSSSTSFVIANSRKGIYLIHIKLDNGLQETHRILKY